ncbi:MAG: hypothetical protein ACFNX9_08135 [Eikenella corrodens]|uniref:hypothetical protein n=1 Tax=Eikenella corrodens TaxID=539 RepID=UPI00361FF282
MNTEICSQDARYMAQYRLFEITGYLKISGSLPLTLWRINLFSCSAGDYAAAKVK